MLCQSWGGTVRVFPAVPAAWADLVVHNFRTQGAFLLSAVREGGRVRWVRLRKGESALITARGDRPDLRIRPVVANAPAPAWGLPA